MKSDLFYPTKKKWKKNSPSFDIIESSEEIDQIKPLQYP